MKAEITISLAELRRRLPPGLVARQYGNVVQIYALPTVEFSATAEQRAAYDVLRQVAAAWNSFDSVRRKDWNDYVRRHESLFRSSRKTLGPTGYQVFSQAARRRVMLGLGADLPGPFLRPPEPLTDLRLEPASPDDPREFRFTVDHRLTPGPDHVVIIRMTPATRGPARKPRIEDSRLMAGWSPQSARELPPTGTTLVYAEAPFAIAPGRRFGVWARIVRVADGLASAELVRDFVRV